PAGARADAGRRADTIALRDWSAAGGSPELIPIGARGAQLQHRLAALEIHHLRFDPAIAAGDGCGHRAVEHAAVGKGPAIAAPSRSEERRVGKEGGRRSGVEHYVEEAAWGRR